MATKWSYFPVKYDGVNYHVMQTKADNIKLVRYKVENYIATMADYGMNASYFQESTSIILNIAYQNGKNVGPDDQGKINDGCGYGVVAWNGSDLTYYPNVKNGSGLNLPLKSGTWAQGGFPLYLCNPNWKDAIINIQGGNWVLFDEDTGFTEVLKTMRTGILINKNTKDVYLFMTTAFTTVDNIRGAMMDFAGIVDSSGPKTNPWEAILTDGGRSAQMYCGPYQSFRPIGCRCVPQVIALVDNT